MSNTFGPSLKIALIAPVWFEIPPTAYGGIEWICAWLTEGLIAKGHDVTLIAAGRNRTSARFLQTFAEPPSERLGESMPEAIHAAAVDAHLRDLDIDIIHDHTLCGPLSARGRSVQTMVTAHGPVAGELGSYFRQLGNSISLVAISNSQRAEAPDLTGCATVHNAIPVTEYPFSSVKDDFLLFLGRMSPDKGAHLAIEAARAAGRPLVIAGKCNEPLEKAYFEREIVPRLGPDITWVGQADAQTKKDLMARAHCFLFPIRWAEPFGIVMVEAMACGTPVVALRGGSVNEVIAHGQTGYICDRPSELPGFIDRAAEISPAACRAHAMSKFDVSKMVDGYEKAFLDAVRTRIL
jgi:glycosyltransferase involved in cell wall biosynthesis